MHHKLKADQMQDEERKPTRRWQFVMQNSNVNDNVGYYICYYFVCKLPDGYGENGTDFFFVNVAGGRRGAKPNTFSLSIYEWMDEWDKLCTKYIKPNKLSPSLYRL